MRDALVDLLINQKSYPVNLAVAIGIENAVSVNEIIKFCGFNPGPKENVERLLKNAGVKKPTDTLFELSKIGIILDDQISNIRINTKYFDEYESELVVKVDKSHSEIYNHPDFKRLFRTWMSIHIAKGSKKKEKDLLILFQGKTLQQSIKALELSINNRYLSIFFNERENDRGNSEKYRADSRSGAYEGSGKRDGETSEGIREERKTVRKGFSNLEESEI